MCASADARPASNWLTWSHASSAIPTPPPVAGVVTDRRAPRWRTRLTKTGRAASSASLIGTGHTAAPRVSPGGFFDSLARGAGSVEATSGTQPTEQLATDRLNDATRRPARRSHTQRRGDIYSVPRARSRRTMRATDPGMAALEQRARCLFEKDRRRNRPAAARLHPDGLKGALHPQEPQIAKGIPSSPWKESPRQRGQGSRQSQSRPAGRDPPPTQRIMGIAALFKAAASAGPADHTERPKETGHTGTISIFSKRKDPLQAGRARRLQRPRRR